MGDGTKNHCEGCGERIGEYDGYAISGAGVQRAEKSFLCGDCAFELIVSERRSEELAALADRILAEKARREQKINSAAGGALRV